MNFRFKSSFPRKLNPPKKLPFSLLTLFPFFPRGAWREEWTWKNGNNPCWLVTLPNKYTKTYEQEKIGWWWWYDGNNNSTSSSTTFVTWHHHQQPIFFVEITNINAFPFLGDLSKAYTHTGNKTAREKTFIFTLLTLLHSSRLFTEEMNKWICIHIPVIHIEFYCPLLSPINHNLMFFPNCNFWFSSWYMTWCMSKKVVIWAVYLHNSTHMHAHMRKCNDDIYVSDETTIKDFDRIIINHFLLLLFNFQRTKREKNNAKSNPFLFTFSKKITSYLIKVLQT